MLSLLLLLLPPLLLFYYYHYHYYFLITCWWWGFLLLLLLQQYWVGVYSVLSVDKGLLCADTSFFLLWCLQKDNVASAGFMSDYCLFRVQNTNSIVHKHAKISVQCKVLKKPTSMLCIFSYVFSTLCIQLDSRHSK